MTHNEVPVNLETTASGFSGHGESAKMDVKPSGSFHGFDTGYAMAYGAEEAIVLHHFQYLIRANAVSGHNFREGRYWTYDTVDDIRRHFPYWSLKQIRRILNSLVDQGVIIKNTYNKHWTDRTTWYAFQDEDKFVITHVPKKVVILDDSEDTGDIKENSTVFPKWENESFPNGKFSIPQMGSSIPNNIPNNILNTNTLPTPSNSEPADADATHVAVGGDHSSNLKKTKKPKEFSPEVREVASKMLAIVAKHNPVYRPPDNLEKFMAQVEEMLVKDKQDPETLLRTFEWACADSEQRDSFKGWQSVVCTNKRRGKASNPAEVFRGHFATIYSQMKAQPKRKFAPSSNDERSLEKMKEWMKGAL